MTMHYQYKLDPGLAPEVHDGVRTATIRFDDERDIRPGDVISLIDAETGEKIASREVTSVGAASVGDALELVDRLGGRYPTDRPEELLSSLQGYYPDDDITMGTRVTLIVFAGPDGGSEREQVGMGDYSG